MADTSDVTRTKSGRLVYRGESFPGYNQQKRTPGKNKKFAVLAKKGDQVKIVRYGDPNMSIKKNQPGRRKISALGTIAMQWKRKKTFSLPPTGRAKIGDLMTVMFMTEAGRKTGDSNIDRLAAEYEDTYGMPLSDAQIERLDQLSDSPEFGNYAIDTSGFVSDAPFGSPQRIAELREFTSRLRAERDAKRAKLTLEAAGISPDQPVSRSP